MNEDLPPKLGALELSCLDFPAMVSWYRDQLPAEIEHRDAMHAWLRAPGGWHLVLTASGFEPRPRECGGLAGVALEYPSLAELGSIYRSFKERGIYPERAVKNGLATSLVYRDPDGNPVHLRYIVPSSARPQGALNPLGDEFDPALIFDASSSVTVA